MFKERGKAKKLLCETVLYFNQGLIGTNANSYLGNDPNPFYFAGLARTSESNGVYPLAGTLDMKSYNGTANYNGIIKHNLNYSPYYKNDTDYIYHIKYHISNFKNYRDAASYTGDVPGGKVFPDIKIGAACGEINNSAPYDILKQHGSYLTISNNGVANDFKSLSPSTWLGETYDVFFKPGAAGLDPITSYFEVNSDGLTNVDNSIITSLEGLQVWRIKEPGTSEWTEEGTFDFISEANGWTFDTNNYSNIDYFYPSLVDSYLRLKVAIDSLVYANGYFQSPELNISPYKIYKLDFSVISTQTHYEKVPTLEIGVFTEDGQEIQSIIEANTCYNTSDPSDDVNIAPINTTSIPYTVYFYPTQKNISSDNIKMRFKFGLRWNNSETYAADKAIVYLQLKDFTYSSTDYSYFEN